MKKTIIAAIAATLAGLSSISVCAKESAWEGDAGGARMALSFPFEGVCRVRYTKRGAFAAEGTEPACASSAANAPRAG